MFAPGLAFPREIVPFGLIWVDFGKANEKSKEIFIRNFIGQIGAAGVVAAHSSKAELMPWLEN